MVETWEVWGAGAEAGGPLQGTMLLRAQHSPQPGPKPGSPDECHLQGTCALSPAVGTVPAGSPAPSSLP